MRALGVRTFLSTTNCLLSEVTSRTMVRVIVVIEYIERKRKPA